MMFVEFIEDSHGDLVDIIYYCSRPCAAHNDNAHGWPGGMETQFAIYCHYCGDKIQDGLDAHSPDDRC